jgi:hypothetical protein
MVFTQTLHEDCSILKRTMALTTRRRTSTIGSTLDPKLRRVKRIPVEFQRPRYDFSSEVLPVETIDELYEP